LRNLPARFGNPSRESVAWALIGKEAHRSVWHLRRGQSTGTAAVQGQEEAASSDPNTTRSGPLQAFWKFLRPHTIRGTILGSSAMTARAVIENGASPDWSLLPTAACGVLALLCGNGFIVGINQIYDVSIDKINKPYLPVAAQEISVSAAWLLCLVMAVTGTVLAWRLFGQLIGILYAFGLFLGVIYSVPPLRLKRSAVAAALIIATVRGFLLNFGVYYATRSMLGVAMSWSSPTAWMTSFGVIFALVIAVTKDLPDVEGDREGNVETFATRFGVAKVSLAATLALITNYAQSIAWAYGPAGGAFFRPTLMVGSQVAMAALLLRGWLRARKASFTQEALKAFYRLIWLVFYLQYMLFPFV